jgi:hypothetical protein
MSFMDKMKEHFDQAKEGVSDFAATTKIKHEISNLNDRKAVLLSEIGRQVYALYGQGRVPGEVDAQCREIQAIEEQIKTKAAHIANISAGLA